MKYKRKQLSEPVCRKHEHKIGSAVKYGQYVFDPAPLRAGSARVAISEAILGFKRYGYGSSMFTTADLATLVVRETDDGNVAIVKLDYVAPVATAQAQAQAQEPAQPQEYHCELADYDETLAQAQGAMVFLHVPEALLATAAARKGTASNVVILRK